MLPPAQTTFRKLLNRSPAAKRPRSPLAAQLPPLPLPLFPAPGDPWPQDHAGAAQRQGLCGEAEECGLGPRAGLAALAATSCWVPWVLLPTCSPAAACTVLAPRRPTRTASTWAVSQRSGEADWLQPGRNRAGEGSGAEAERCRCRPLLQATCGRATSRMWAATPASCAPCTATRSAAALLVAVGCLVGGSPPAESPAQPLLSRACLPSRRFTQSLSLARVLLHCPAPSDRHGDGAEGRYDARRLRYLLL